jgi:hypothetical protein
MAVGRWHVSTLLDTAAGCQVNLTKNSNVKKLAQKLGLFPTDRRAILRSYPEKGE